MLWPSHRDQLFRSLEVRMQERTANLGRWLQERAEKEASDMRAILEELERSIWAELDEADQPQLELFSTPEREQFARVSGEGVQVADVRVGDAASRLARADHARVHRPI